MRLGVDGRRQTSRSWMWLGVWGLVGACTTGGNFPGTLSFGTGGQADTGDESADDGEDTESDADTANSGSGDTGTGSNSNSNSNSASDSDSASSTGTDSASASASETATGTTSTTGEDGSSSSGEPTECMPGVSESCYTGPAGTEDVGECASGTRTCDSTGSWGDCEDEALPGTESCNGLDDDCDDVVDNDNPGGGGLCNTGLDGPCQDGTLTCQNAFLDCVPDVDPDPTETCGDDIDNDCNGTVDDGCTCDPLSPAGVCGINNHCVPQTDGTTECVSPTGFGTQYSGCVSSADCASIYECVQTGFGTVYCMQWCSSDFDCPGILDTCVGLAPAVYVGAVEWGVCYDGFP